MKIEWSKILTGFGLLAIIWAIIVGHWLIVQLLAASAYEQTVTLYLGVLGIVTIFCGVIVGFYFWKAKAENLVKIAKDLNKCGISDDVAGKIIETNQITGGT
jgi:uncharacterized membrane protein